MRTFFPLSMAVAILVSASTPAMAASNTSDPFVITAEVTATLTLSVTLKKNDSSGAVVTGMDFGRLVDIGTGTLRSSATSTTATGAVAAFITTNSHGTPYTVTQTGTALSNGTTTLPSGACTVVPTYSAADNGGASMPAGAVVGSAGSWVGTRTLYTSETGLAAMRTITAYYSITDDTAAGATTGVPMNQPGGAYTGTITITATA